MRVHCATWGSASLLETFLVQDKDIYAIANIDDYSVSVQFETPEDLFEFKLVYGNDYEQLMDDARE